MRNIADKEDNLSERKLFYFGTISVCKQLQIKALYFGQRNHKKV